MRYMEWKPAADVRPQQGDWYLVWDNGEEWGDPHIHTMSGALLRMYLEKRVVRGRPLFAARVTDPTVAAPEKRRVSSCGCSYRGCKDWHVAPEAAVQCVKFSEEQARAVAALLDEMDV